MSPIRVTWSRTLGGLRSQFSSVLAFAAFLAGTSALLVFNLDQAEGGRMMLPALWAMSVSPVLPVLAAVLGMDVWSGERQSGRVDVLLSTAVRERSFVLGKFLGVWTMLAVAVLCSLVFTLSLLGFFAPSTLAGIGVWGMMPAVGALMIQGLLWGAVSLAASACFKRGAVAALVTVLILVALPRALWLGLMTWSSAGRPAFGEMPLDAHAIDWASGAVSISTIAGYLALTALTLFFTAKLVMSWRFVGKGAAGLRWSTGVTFVLSAVLAVLVVLLASRHEFAVELPMGGNKALSPRTNRVLSESSGDISITCFLSRKDPRFRDVGRLLRRFQRASASLGGASIELRYVDPRWDLSASERLSRRGVEESSLVFERGRRQAVLPLKGGFGERPCATAIQRVSAPSLRRVVYWTVGHGEAAFDGYGVFGMSDIAREMAQAGYRNAALDLAATAQMPSDCAMVVVAGARNDFSRAEVGRIEAYLRDGGRLLVLLGSSQGGGVVSLLPSWGIRIVPLSRVGVKTLSGTDVISRDFTDHVITASLQGSQLVLESPVALSPSAIAETGAGVDRLAFSALAEVGESIVAAAVERGADVGRDLALRPTRIVAVGDATFAMNGPLASRANANRDFFLNCVAYLSGMDAAGGDGTESGLLQSGLDRDRQLMLLLFSVGILPMSAWLLLTAVIFIRRRRV